MALFQVTFRSQVLDQYTAINVVIPEDCQKENIPTLYLLHGMHGDHSAWVRKSAIERYADRYKIAVVCPDGENSYYTDMKYGKDFYTYLTEELIDYTRKIFRLSTRREDTYICGLSMGGYGALHTALLRPDLFCAAASLSGVLDLPACLDVCNWEKIAITVWGEDFKTAVRNSEADLFHLVKNFPKDSPKPRIFACCGKQDFLYCNNLRFRDFMETTDFDFSWDEGDGIHDWNFWDRWVRIAIQKMINR